MKITNIRIDAEGYYSGNYYEESVAIRTEIYNKLKTEIDNAKCYIGELDGKHSEVKADLEVFNFTKDEDLEMYLDVKKDGETLYYKLCEIFKNNNLDIDEEIGIVNKYIDSLDAYTEITVKVRKSNVDKVKEFCKNL